MNDQFQTRINQTAEPARRNIRTDLLRPGSFVRPTSQACRFVRLKLREKKINRITIRAAIEKALLKCKKPYISEDCEFCLDLPVRIFVSRKGIMYMLLASKYSGEELP